AYARPAVAFRRAVVGTGTNRDRNRRAVDNPRRVDGVSPTWGCCHVRLHSHYRRARGLGIDWSAARRRSRGVGRRGPVSVPCPRRAKTRPRSDPQGDFSAVVGVRDWGGSLTGACRTHRLVAVANATGTGGRGQPDRRRDAWPRRRRPL